MSDFILTMSHSWVNAVDVVIVEIYQHDIEKILQGELFLLARREGMAMA